MVLHLLRSHNPSSAIPEKGQAPRGTRYRYPSLGENYRLLLLVAHREALLDKIPGEPLAVMV